MTMYFVFTEQLCGRVGRHFYQNDQATYSLTAFGVGGREGERVSFLSMGFIN